VHSLKRCPGVAAALPHHIRQPSYAMTRQQHARLPNCMLSVTACHVTTGMTVHSHIGTHTKATENSMQLVKLSDNHACKRVSNTYTYACCLSRWSPPQCLHSHTGCARPKAALSNTLRHNKHTKCIATSTIVPVFTPADQHATCACMSYEQCQHPAHSSHAQSPPLGHAGQQPHPAVPRVSGFGGHTTAQEMHCRMRLM
jgi:hypothetical protein